MQYFVTLDKYNPFKQMSLTSKPKTRILKLFFRSFGGKIQNSKADKNQGTKNIEKHQASININVCHLLSLASWILRNQKTIDPTVPDVITYQAALSRPKTRGTTKVAKNTWPISRLISDKVLNWESVNSTENLGNI